MIDREHTQNNSLEKLLSPLSGEQRETLLALPRQQRFQRLATLLSQPEDETLRQVSNASQLTLLDHPEFLAKPQELLPLRVIHEYQCLPIEKRQKNEATDTIPLTTVWPPDEEMDQWIYVTCGRRPSWFLSLPQLITDNITQSFGIGAGSLDESEMEILEEEAANEVEEDENAAIIKFVNEVIAKAITDRATDIHFEPQRDLLQIRYRIDGQLAPVRVPENLIRFQSAIISRLKIMARLNISEKRRPQDGRIAFEQNGQELDIRISSLPTMYGESISLRLLTQKSSPLSLKEIGFSKQEQTIIHSVLQRPHGIILVTGPTGSGKSTSLTAFIREIRNPKLRIITVEDPVEYEVNGVNQTQVHPEIGLNFATALRHILRQDPDVLMIGEIRDRETADIAIRASLTGHLVLSTLHTNDASGALTRLIDMGIEPFLIASSVEMIIAQRLVRRLCPSCCLPSTQDADYLKSCLSRLGIAQSEYKQANKIKTAQGCDACNGIGYRGRIAITELLKTSDKIHELVIKSKSAQDIRQQAIADGMRTLQQRGWELVKEGLTTLPEILRFADTSEETENNA